MTVMIGSVSMRNYFNNGDLGIIKSVSIFMVSLDEFLIDSIFVKTRSRIKCQLELLMFN